MEYSHADTVIIAYDKEKELLMLYDVYSDGTKVFCTQVELSKLQATDIDTTCRAVGKMILASLPTIRQTLFS